MNGRNSGSMPWPLSSTESEMLESTRSKLTLTRPPFGVNLIRVVGQVPKHLLQSIGVSGEARRRPVRP
jgi:hypothetical protein